MLDVALILVFTAHLLAANIASGLPFVCLWLLWRDGPTAAPEIGTLGRRLAWHCLPVTGVAVTLGLISLGLLYLLRPVEIAHALAVVPSRGVFLGMPERLWSGVGEVVLYLLTMLAMQRTWHWGSTSTGLARWMRRSVPALCGLFAGTNLLYHLPVLFAVLTVLATRPALAANPGSFIALLGNGEVVARTLHGWIAAFAVTGAWLIYLALRDPAQELAGRLARWGGTLAAIPTGLQWLIGPMVLLSLPARSTQALIGQDPLATLLFVVSLGLSFWLLQELLNIAGGESQPPAWRRALWILATVVLLMVTVRHQARWAVWNAPPVEAAGPAAGPAAHL